MKRAPHLNLMNLNGREQLLELVMDGRTILKWILKIYDMTGFI
jgi:hypothetical protein